MKSYLIQVVVPVLAVFLATVSVSIGIITSIIINQKSTLEDDMNNSLLTISLATKTNYAAVVTVVSLLGNVMTTFRNISPQQFNVLTRPLVATSGIAGCAFAPKVLNQDRQAFESQLSKEYGRQLFISNPSNPSQPAPTEPYYFPFSRNSQGDTTTLGSDNNEIPDRRDIIERTIATGTVQISTPVTVPLMNKSALIFTQAIYTCNSTDPSSCVVPSDPKARANSTFGIISCPVAFSNLSQQIVESQMRENRNAAVTVSLCIGNYVAYQTDNSKGCQGDFSSSFELGGQMFTAYISSTSLAYLGYAVYVSVVLFGLMIVILPAMLYWLLRNRRKYASSMIEESRKEERQRAQTISDAMKTLLHCTSHDMRAPLQACINAVGLLKDELKAISSEMAINLFDVIIGSTSLLEALMDNILDCKKIESATLELVESPTDLSPKIQNLVTMIRTASLAPDEVNIIANIDDRIPTVMCDSSKVQRIIMNLVSNAAKFTKSGAITINFNLAAELDDNNVKVFVQVKDTGCGMTKEQMTLLGTPYVHSSATKGGGSGLGIYICKSYAEMYGGVFNVQSTVGQGTSISFTLTFRKPDAASLIAKQATQTLSSDELSVAVTTPGHEAVPRQLKVLYCEDHPVTRKVMAMMLEKMGCTVDVAVDGLEASQKIVNKYDVVFMDMQMPHKNGHEVVQDFRELERTHLRRRYRTPIIALTGNASEEDVTIARAAGCDHHLSKPTRKESIHQILDSIRRGGLADLQVSDAVIGTRRDLEVEFSSLRSSPSYTPLPSPILRSLSQASPFSQSTSALLPVAPLGNVQRSYSTAALSSSSCYEVIPHPSVDSEFVDLPNQIMSVADYEISEKDEYYGEEDDEEEHCAV